MRFGLRYLSTYKIPHPCHSRSRPGLQHEHGTPYASSHARRNGLRVIRNIGQDGHLPYSHPRTYLTDRPLGLAHTTSNNVVHFASSVKD
jgi:hypothetical protein